MIEEYNIPRLLPLTSQGYLRDPCLDPNVTIAPDTAVAELMVADKIVCDINAKREAGVTIMNGTEALIAALNHIARAYMDSVMFHHLAPVLRNPAFTRYDVVAGIRLVSEIEKLDISQFESLTKTVLSKNLALEDACQAYNIIATFFETAFVKRSFLDLVHLPRCEPLPLILEKNREKAEDLAKKGLIDMDLCANISKAAFDTCVKKAKKKVGAANIRQIHANKPILGPKPKILICGRTCAGKDTLANALEKLAGLTQLKSYTDRDRRPGEGDTHIFVDTQDLPDKNVIARTIIDGHTYLATKDQFENADIYVIDPIGIKNLGKQIEQRGISCENGIVIVYVDAEPMVRRIRWMDRNADGVKSREDLLDEFMNRCVSEEPQFIAFQEALRGMDETGIDDDLRLVVINNGDDIETIAKNLSEIIDSCK